MFSGVLQKELVSILYSCGSKPLAQWECKVLACASKNPVWDTRQAKNGHIKRITDTDIRNSLVLELTGTNVATTYIAAPANQSVSLGIKLPFLSMLVKNLKKYFSFEITILDDKNMRRRLRASNYQSTTRVRPFCCTMPLALNDGWNQIQFNLADFCRRAYGTMYVECVRVQIHANCRVRRVYFSDHLFSEGDLPASYRLSHGDEVDAQQQQQQQQQQQMEQQQMMQQAMLQEGAVA